MKRLPLLSLLLLLPACVGGSFGNHREIEEYPLRGATKEEGRRLKRCLRAAYQTQQEHERKTGKYARHVRELPLDDACQGFILAQRAAGGGVEIMAQFHENDATVRWSINPEGVIEEHLDPEAGPDLDLEF